jgi:hypothetical protein
MEPELQRVPKGGSAELAEERTFATSFDSLLFRRFSGFVKASLSLTAH